MRILVIVAACLLVTASARPAVDKRENFFDHLFGTLKLQFNALGQTFSETFKQLGETAAQQGAELLQQTLQQGAQLATNGAQTLVTNLVNPDGTRKRFLKEDFAHMLDVLKQQFSALGQTFGETFKQVGELAVQQGTDLLSQTLQQGAQIAVQGAQTLATNLQNPDGTKKRFLLSKEDLEYMKAQLHTQFSALGDTFKETFNQVGQAATEQGQDLLHQLMQQGVNIALHGAVDLAQNLAHPDATTTTKAPSKRENFFEHLFGTLKLQFNALGETFAETFKQVGETAAQQGAELLQQTLQQGAQLAQTGAETLVTNLATGTGKRENFFDHLFSTLKLQFNALGQTFAETFKQVGETAAQQGAELLQQTLQQGAQLAQTGAETLVTNLATGKRSIQCRLDEPDCSNKRESFFDHLFGTLKQQFSALGQTFAETFKQVGETAAQQGAELLQQTLQQGAQLAQTGAETLVTNLATGKRSVQCKYDDPPCSNKRESFFDHLFGTLKQQFSALGQTFAETFKQVGETAAQQGAELLQQTLQQGAQLATNGAQTLVSNLVNPDGTTK